jgi:hypothetical protein
MSGIRHIRGIRYPGNSAYSIGGFSSQYQAVYDSFTTKPSGPVAAAQDTMVKGWISNGVWNTKDILYVLAGHTNDNGESLINWKNPGTYDAEIVLNSGTMNFTAFEGFQSSNNAYLRTNYNPFSNGVQYTQNDCSMGIYSRTTFGPDNLDVLCGSENIRIISLIPLYSGDLWTALNTTTPVRTTYAGGDSGFIGTFRDSSSAIRSYINLSKEQDTSSTSGAIPDAEIYIKCQNRIGTGPDRFINDQVSNFWMGGSETESEYTNYLNGFETYMDSNGKGVIT